MNGLVTWLRAQLDEDERVARGATPGPWTVSRSGEDVHSYDQGLTVSEGFSGGPWSKVNPVHIARWDPARVLAEVAADRRLLDEYEQARTYYDLHREAPAGEAYGLLTAVKIRALPYADKPGYREEWRPS
jgi:hypothetical protein